MCNVAGIFVQGHMAIMWNVYIPVLVVTLFTAVNLYVVYILTYLPHICTWIITYVAYMWHLMGMFGIDINMTRAWQIKVAVCRFFIKLSSGWTYYNCTSACVSVCPCVCVSVSHWFVRQLLTHLPLCIY